MIKGKLLGHIISKEGIIIDHEHVKVILQLTYPHTKKLIYHFLKRLVLQGDLFFISQRLLSHNKT